MALFGYTKEDWEDIKGAPGAIKGLYSRFPSKKKKKRVRKPKKLLVKRDYEGVLQSVPRFRLKKQEIVFRKPTSGTTTPEVLRKKNPYFR